MNYLLPLVILLSAILVAKVAAVNHGIDQFGNLPGNFYVFNSSATYIVEPLSGSIVNTIPGGSSSYGDAIYIEDQAQLKHLVFITQSNNNLVTVLDTETQSVITSMAVGNRPVHAFAVYYNDEVWIHLDLEGSFDVISMAEPRYRSSSGIKPSPLRIGHGKLLFHPNLGQIGFATNVNETGILQLSMLTRQFTEKIPISNAQYTCAGTHGIDYSQLTNRVYAECSNPSTCKSPYTNATLCTGSLWSVDAATRKVVTRFVSPSLSALYGANFGIQGQPYHSPEGSLIIVPNKNLNVLHILKLSLSTTKIIEIQLAKPGNIQFYGKNSALVFGVDSNPANYVMALGVTNGVALIDMSDVMAAFASDQTTLMSSLITIVAVPTFGTSRTIVRGGDYVMVPLYTSATVTTSLAVISFKSKAIVSYVKVGSVLKSLWVPLQSTQVESKITALTTQIGSLTYGTNSITSTSSSSDAIILAAVAIALSAIAVLLAAALLRLRHTDATRELMMNDLSK